MYWFIKYTQAQITELPYTTRFTSRHKTEDYHFSVKHFSEISHNMFKKAITETYAELHVRKNQHYRERYKFLKVCYLVRPFSQNSPAASGPVQLHLTN